jgi:hypothetical protein
MDRITARRVINQIRHRREVPVPERKPSNLAELLRSPQPRRPIADSPPGTLYQAPTSDGSFLEMVQLASEGTTIH